MNRGEWVWMPHAGHFILGPQCRFHLNTYVGGYIVSTVGELVQDSQVQRIHAQIHDPQWFANSHSFKGDRWRAEYQRRFGFNEIGLGRTYETMVFTAKSGDPAYPCCPWEMATPESVDFDRYTDAGDAYRGHLAMCERWAEEEASDQCPVCVDANARRPAEWQPPDDGRLYTLVACSGCGNGYPLRYLAQLEDGRYLCRACFDVWMEEEQ